MAITRVSTTSGGQQADGDSFITPNYGADSGPLGPNAFSADGNEIVFITTADNIGDGSSELVLKNLTTNVDTVVTQASSASFTPDGQKLIYSAFDNGAVQIYEAAGNGANPVLVSSASDGTEGYSFSNPIAVSTNGNRVAFDSEATNLVPNQNTNVTSFVKDIPSGKIVQLGDGTTANAASEDFSYAPDLSEAVYTNEPDDVAGAPAPEVYAENLTDGSKILVSGSNGIAGNKGGFGGILLSGGNRVVFNSLSTDLVATAPTGGIFVKTLSSGAISTVLANNIVTNGATTSGTAYQLASASPDGSQIAYYKYQANVTKNGDGSDQGTATTQIFVRNLASGAETAVTQPTSYSFTDGKPTDPGSPDEAPFGNSGDSDTGSINGSINVEPVYSADGSKIAYSAQTYSNFTHDDTTMPSTDSGTVTSQIFVYNVNTGVTTPVTDPVSCNAATKSGDSYGAFSFSPDGKDIEVEHFSQQSGQSTSQAIVTDIASGARTIVPVDSAELVFGPNGSNSVAFASDDGTLVQNDTNQASDVFIETLQQCFVTGTAIRTASGAIAVEALRVGDLAETAAGALRPIVWIGSRVVECRARKTPSESWPVRIRAGAFGRDLPERDLLLSPGHPVLVGEGADEVLVPIMCLINGTSIMRLPVETVTYWHVELDAHDILLAEGLPAESYFDLGSRAWFDGGTDGPLTNPDFIAPGRGGRCRTIAVEGPQVETERRRLDTLFATGLTTPCAWPTDDPAAFWH